MDPHAQNSGDAAGPPKQWGRRWIKNFRKLKESVKPFEPKGRVKQLDKIDNFWNIAKIVMHVKLTVSYILQ